MGTTVLLISLALGLFFLLLKYSVRLAIVFESKKAKALVNNIPKFKILQEGLKMELFQTIDNINEFHSEYEPLGIVLQGRVNKVVNESITQFLNKFYLKPFSEDVTCHVYAVKSKILNGFYEYVSDKNFSDTNGNHFKSIIQDNISELSSIVVGLYQVSQNTVTT